MNHRQVLGLGVATIALAFALGCSSSKKKTDAAATEAKAAETKVTKTTTTKTKTKTKTTTTESTDWAGTVTCTIKGDKRTIAIENEDGTCKVMYNKMGETKEVATGAKGSNHCETVATRIQNNLGKAGFTCKQ